VKDFHLLSFASVTGALGSGSFSPPRQSSTLLRRVTPTEKFATYFAALHESGRGTREKPFGAATIQSGM